MTEPPRDTRHREKLRPLVEVAKTKLVSGVATSVGVGIGAGVVAAAAGGGKWLSVWLASSVGAWIWSDRD
jgi:amino acid permease